MKYIVLRGQSRSNDYDNNSCRSNLIEHVYPMVLVLGLVMWLLDLVMWSFDLVMWLLAHNYALDYIMVFLYLHGFHLLYHESRPAISFKVCGFHSLNSSVKS